MKTKIKIILISFLLLGMFNCTNPVDETPYCWTCTCNLQVNGENSVDTRELCDKTKKQIKEIEDDWTGKTTNSWGYIESSAKCNIKQ